MTTTPHLGLTLLEMAQAQKEVTMNTALVALDAVLNTGAISKNINTPPSSPSTGDVYIVAASPTGAWVGQAGNIAFYNQTWQFITPREGMLLWVNDESLIYTYNGSAWQVAADTGTVTSVALSMPGEFSVAGSPVTSSGTLAVTKAHQNANQIYAGPASGSAAAPGFRALVAADLPNPTTSSIGGVQAVNTVSHQWINAINSGGVPALSQPAFGDISGTATSGQLPSTVAYTTASQTFSGNNKFSGEVIDSVASAGSSGQVLTSTGSAVKWQSPASGGGVSSFSGDGTILSNSSSTGAVTATLETQSANKVLAGPTSGSAVAPTFRALTGADLPAPTSSALGGVEAISAVSHKWINAINTSGVPQLSQPASSDLSDYGSVPNAALANASVTVTAGTGMSGGGAVSLGSSVTLSNAGVTSFSAGSTGLTPGSASTGAISLAGTLAVANGGTGDTGTAWTSYTPTITAAIGTLTTVSATGRYKTLGKTCWIEIVITLTTNGTGSGALSATLPSGVTAESAAMLVGREIVSIGKMLHGDIAASATSISPITFYDASYPGGNNTGHILSGVFEKQ